jgi:hypothetical protein
VSRTNVRWVNRVKLGIEAVPPGICSDVFDRDGIGRSSLESILVQIMLLNILVAEKGSNAGFGLPLT